MKIIYTPQAHKDLRDIHDYISFELSNPFSAEKIVSKIIESISDLEQFPQMGYLLSEKTGRNTPYRCLICENHIIFYLIDNGIVKIIRILDGRTDYLKAIF